MWFAAAVGSALLFGFAGWWMKVSQMRGGASAYLLLGLYLSGAAGFGIHSAIGRTLEGSLANPRVWVAGLLIGAGSALGNALFMKALECGPASLTSPLTNMNIVLVVALGTFVYNEPFAGFELAGVSLLLLAVIFVSIRGKEKLTILQRNWYVYVGLSIFLFALRNGGLKVTDAAGLNGSAVLFVSYALSVLWFAAAAARERAAGQRAGAGLSPTVPSASPPAGAGRHGALSNARSIGLRWGIVAGLFSYGGLQLYTVALQSGQVNIAGPIFAANSMVVAVGSIVLYREKLTGLQWVAFTLTFAGLILIRL